MPQSVFSDSRSLSGVSRFLTAAWMMRSQTIRVHLKLMWGLFAIYRRSSRLLFVAIVLSAVLGRLVGYICGSFLLAKSDPGERSQDSRQ